MRSLADVDEAGPCGQHIAQRFQHVLCAVTSSCDGFKIQDGLDCSLTCECLHPLRSAAHADVLDVSEHLLEVVAAGAEGEVVEDVLLHLLDVGVDQLHLLPTLAPQHIHNGITEMFKILGKVAMKPY